MVLPASHTSVPEDHFCLMLLPLSRLLRELLFCTAMGYYHHTSPSDDLRGVTCPQATVMSPHTHRKASTYRTPAFISIFSILCRPAMNTCSQKSLLDVCVCLAQAKITLVTSGSLRSRHQLSKLSMPKGSNILAGMVRGNRRRLFLVIMCSVGLDWQHQSSQTNTW